MSSQASTEVIQLLYDLVSRWIQFSENKDYYLNSRLPRLKRHRDWGNPIEKYYLNQLRIVATESEWNNLEDIASEINFQPQNWHFISSSIESILLDGDIKTAFNFIKSILPENQKVPDMASLSLLSSALRKNKPYLDKILLEIQKACKVYDFELAEKLSAKLDTSYGKQKSKGLIESAKLKHEKDFLNACNVYNFELAEILLGKLDIADTKQKFRNLIDSAKARQKNEIIEEKVSQIQGACAIYDFELAEELIAKFDSIDTKQNFRDLIKTAKEKQKNEIIEEKVGQIQDACAIYDFELAEDLIAKLEDINAKQKSRNLFNSAKLKHKKQIRKKFVDSIKEEIIICLQGYDYSRAASLYSEIETDFSQEWYSNLVRWYQKKQEKDEFGQMLGQVFRSGNFFHAKTLYSESNFITSEEYFDIKAKSISEITEEKYCQRLNKEQAYALAEISNNTLIKARAGSGKTRIIVTKTALLLDYLGVELDKLVVLAFNKKAAEEINQRMQEPYNKPIFKNAFTFHSLAYRIVNKKLDILTDLSENSKKNTQTQFVQNALREVLQDKLLLSNAYQFLRSEIDELENNSLLKDEEEFYAFQRGFPQITLCGERVFSRLEKIIADFLFEHNIDYQYSKKGFSLKPGYFRPTFYLITDDDLLIIETWEHYNSRIDGIHEPSEEAIREKIKSLCEKDDIRFLEYNKDMEGFSRLEIESDLKGFLQENDITFTKLSVDELQTKVFNNPHVKTRLATLCTQFIQRSKKLSIFPDDLKQKVATYNPIDERESKFLELIGIVYSTYEKEKKHKGKIDFDDLLLMAIHKIGLLKGNNVIKLVKSSQSLRLNQLDWILVDEYQDFSELFYCLISEIKKYNSTVRLFCVGDDWQAINGFAGSDLRFFNDFDSHIGNSKLLELVTNHRSQAKIVHLGNKLMSGFGSGSEPLQENQNGEIKLLAIEDVQLVLPQNTEKAESTIERDFYFYKSPIEDKICQISTSKYLRLVHAIVTSPAFIGKKVAILSRTNEIHGVSISNFINNLYKWLKSSEQEKIQNQTDFVEISTIHSYKGREADVVILLEVTDSKFPLLHPDNYLQNILGRTSYDVFDEERRLLYVGITRAKSALFLLTEKSRVSPFVKQDLKLDFDDPCLHFPGLKVRNPNILDFQDNWDEDIPF